MFVYRYMHTLCSITYMYIHVYTPQYIMYVLARYYSSYFWPFLNSRDSLPQACWMAVWHTFQISSNFSGSSQQDGYSRKIATLISYSSFCGRAFFCFVPIGVHWPMTVGPNMASLAIVIAKSPTSPLST